MQILERATENEAVPGRRLVGGGDWEDKTADREDLDDIKRVKEAWKEALTTRQGV